MHIATYTLNLIKKPEEKALIIKESIAIIKFIVQKIRTNSFTINSQSSNVILNQNSTSELNFFSSQTKDIEVFTIIRELFYFLEKLMKIAISCHLTNFSEKLVNLVKQVRAVIQCESIYLKINVLNNEISISNIEKLDELIKKCGFGVSIKDLSYEVEAKKLQDSEIKQNFITNCLQAFIKHNSFLFESNKYLHSNQRLRLFLQCAIDYFHIKINEGYRHVPSLHDTKVSKTKFIGNIIEIFSKGNGFNTSVGGNDKIFLEKFEVKNLTSFFLL